MSDMTQDWQLYEAGKNYNGRLDPNYYDTVDANWDFFSGNQWRNLPDNNMPKPVFNIIKRVITFFVASLTTSKAKIHFEPLMYSAENPDPERENDVNGAQIANKQVSALLEKFKMEFKIKDALFDAAITGDAAAHFYYDINKRPYGSGSYGDIKGEICMELVDGANIMFGNANNNKTDPQPYIIVVGRDMIKNLQEEAKRYKDKGGQAETITDDKDYGQQIGAAGRIEVETTDYGKALYIIVYRKVRKSRKVTDKLGIEKTEEYDTIMASKCVKDAYIFKDVDTGLSHYPIAWMNWEKQKNQYHGRALCTGILPNQIFINRMFAMVMYHLMMSAFPKAVYNEDYIKEWDNSVGTAIGVKGLQLNERIANVADYLKPGDMSTQIVRVIELAMQYTKETLGISDAALGQIDPKNTSAIIAVQRSSAIPLENPKANLYEWIEDIGRILFDMMGTYYGKRPVMNESGQMAEFDFSTFKKMWLDTRADVGESSYWSELASIQTLDNLLKGQYIDIIEYLQRMPDDYIPQKQELIAEIKSRMQDPFDVISQLPPQDQVAFLRQPPDVRNKLLEQMKNPPVGVAS